MSDFADAVTNLSSEAGPSAPFCPTRLALADIRTCEPVFQPRNVAENFLASDGHVKALAEAVKEGGADVFAPLLVWWSGKGWYVVDGHHRLEAIHHALKAIPKLGIADVPVEVFAGTLNEAIAEAAASNSQDKLPMRKADKAEAAWKLVVLNFGMTGKQISAAASVSVRTVANMREKRKELLEQGQDPMSLTWEDARKGQRSVIDDDWVERQAREWAKRLVQTFGAKFREQPEIAARALELYSETIPRELVRYWPDEVTAEAEELEEAEF